MAQTIFTHLINSSRPRFLSKLVRDRKEKTFYDDKEDDWEQSVSGIFCRGRLCSRAVSCLNLSKFHLYIYYLSNLSYDSLLY